MFGGLEIVVLVNGMSFDLNYVITGPSSVSSEYVGSRVQSFPLCLDG